jgi:mannose-1-phosphate guanylyltransferase/mannose-6-phosphate isomerase
MSQITPVILVGGSGKRLWPLSRESMPKQFVPLLGKQSTFQQTLERVADRGLFAKPVIATNDAYRFMAEKQAKDIGMEIDILVEPSRRDSGPAMAAAAAYTRNLGAKAVLALASDHLVIGAEEFRQGCRDGLAAVQKGGIVTFGIPPTEPKVDYGYIRPGSESIGPVQKVAAFVEKPTAQKALQYIADGLLWNSGNFLFPPELLLSEMARFEPAMAAAAEEAVAKAKKVGSTVFLDAEAFGKAPAKSIDYAVMERTDKCWVVPAKFRWSDLGTWDALLDVGEADPQGNVVMGTGKVELDHVRNSYIRSDGPLTAVIGMEEVVVVAMGDAVLVGHRDNLPRLKDVVQRMSDGKHKAATEHIVMHRPWGSYQDIDRGERFRAKRLTVVPNGKLSLQSHKRRAEHWVVVRGIAEVTLDGKILTLHENQSVYIPMGGIHRLANPGTEPLEVVEVQTGDYLEEDDITRYEDIYARV